MADKKVVLTAQIGGTRVDADGQHHDWPKPGESITLPAEEADTMIRNGTAATEASPLAFTAQAAAAVRASQLAYNAALLVAQHQAAAGAAGESQEAAEAHLAQLRKDAEEATKAAGKEVSAAESAASKADVDLTVVETATAGTSTSKAVAPGSVVKK